MTRRGVHISKTFAHPVEMGHMAEHHAFINGLQQVYAGVNGLHPVETAGHLESSVAAVQERQEKEIAPGLRQAGNGPG